MQVAAPRPSFFLGVSHPTLVPRCRWILLLLMAGMLNACTNQPEQQRERPETGSALFAHYCESCHGSDARGNGVVVPYLVASVPDLTTIAVRYGCRFSDAEVFHFIDGQSTDEISGQRHMPIWGYEFFGDETDDAQAHELATGRVNRLVAYLRTVQDLALCPNTDL